MQYRIVYTYTEKGADHQRFVVGTTSEFTVTNRPLMATMFDTHVGVKNMLQLVFADIAEHGNSDEHAYIEQRVCKKWVPLTAFKAINPLVHL